jgi:SCY1-like protein 1
MDFLKSAMASAISKGPAFGYTFGDRVDIDESIWTLYNGTKRVWPRPSHTTMPATNSTS